MLHGSVQFRHLGQFSTGRDSLMRKNITLRAIYLPTLPLEFRRRAQQDIVRWLEDGGAQHRIVAYPFSQVVAAHEGVEAGTKRGTVVVEID